MAFRKKFNFITNDPKLRISFQKKRSKSSIPVVPIFTEVAFCVPVSRSTIRPVCDPGNYGWRMRHLSFPGIVDSMKQDSLMAFGCTWTILTMDF